MDSNNLKKIALVAEILGGIGVIVSLFLLVQETRDNTDALQAQTYQSLTSELNFMRRTEIETDIIEIREKVTAEGLDSISIGERRKVTSFEQGIWGILESAYYARERGILGDLEWERFYRAICGNWRNPIWNPDQGPTIARNITPVFREYVESTCD